MWQFRRAGELIVFVATDCPASCADVNEQWRLTYSRSIPLHKHTAEITHKTLPKTKHTLSLSTRMSIGVYLWLIIYDLSVIRLHVLLKMWCRFSLLVAEFNSECFLIILYEALKFVYLKILNWGVIVNIFLVSIDLCFFMCSEAGLL